jgi:hypothetical protein
MKIRQIMYPENGKMQVSMLEEEPEVTEEIPLEATQQTCEPQSCGEIQPDDTTERLDKQHKGKDGDEDIPEIPDAD